MCLGSCAGDDAGSVRSHRISTEGVNLRPHDVRPIFTPIGQTSTPTSRQKGTRHDTSPAHLCTSVPDRRRTRDHPRVPRRHRPARFRGVPAARLRRRTRRLASLLRPVPRSRRTARRRLRDRHADLAGQPRLGRTSRLRRDPTRRDQPSCGRVRDGARRRTPEPAADRERRHRPAWRRLRGRRHHVGVRGRRLPRPAGPGLRRGRRRDDQRDHDDLRRGGHRHRPRRRLGVAPRRHLADRRDRRPHAVRSDARRRDRPDRRRHDHVTGVLHGELRPPHPLHRPASTRPPAGSGASRACGPTPRR